jgi:hypothetical protein
VGSTIGQRYAPALSMDVERAVTGTSAAGGSVPRPPVMLDDGVERASSSTGRRASRLQAGLEQQDPVV